MQQLVCITKELLQKLMQGSLSACLSSSLGLDLIAVCCCNWLDWATAHLGWHLALWGSLLITDESYKDFLEAENIPVLAWSGHSPDMSPIEHVCDAANLPTATLHSHWIGVGQHSIGYNQQLDQLFVKEICPIAWGKWWPHQILTNSFRYLLPKNSFL